MAALVAAAAAAASAADGPARLTNVGGTRRGETASLFLEFDRPVPLPPIASEDHTLRFRLAGVVTDLPRERAYDSFDGVLRLDPDGSDLVVTIRLANAAGPHFLEVLARPPRLAIHRPLERPGPPAAAEGAVRLVNLEGVRYARSAAVTLTFSGPFDFTTPRIAARNITFRLPDVATDLKPFRRYSSFDGWLRLEPAEGGLGVSLALPEGFESSSWHRLDGPPRLLIRFLPETPDGAVPGPAGATTATVPAPVAAPPGPVEPESVGTRLVDLMGTRTAEGAVILLTLSDAFEVGPIRTDLEAIRFRIPDATTTLDAYRPYRGFESWLRLEPVDGGIEVAVGKPVGFDEPLFEVLEDPPRLRIAFSPS